jgi:DNA-directed RNA polymerase subunit N (RpoN/RPB10)
MDSSLTFARIINPVCSCGNYVGRLQPELELELVKKSVSVSTSSGMVTTDEDISDFLNKKGITRICCRNTVIISPVLRLMSVPDQFQIHTDNNSIIKKRMQRIVIGNPDPKIY